MRPMSSTATQPPRHGFVPHKLALFEKDLDTLHALLKKARDPMTALQIKKALGCSKQAAYFRLEALKTQRGVRLKTTKVREGEHGPYSKAYSLL